MDMLRGIRPDIHPLALVVNVDAPLPHATGERAIGKDRAPRPEREHRPVRSVEREDAVSDKQRRIRPVGSTRVDRARSGKVC